MGKLQRNKQGAILMQILTKSHNSEKPLFSGTSRITKTETGVLISENRSRRR